MRILMIALLTMLVGGTAYADGNGKRVQKQPPQVVYVQPQPAPLQRIPVVGTVVYGGLNYAGQLILSPLELITGPQRY